MTVFGYNENVPEAIREIFMMLCQDVVFLTKKWRLYLGLFSDREAAELLSNMARETFQIIEESLRNDMSMAIARLCDPGRMGKHECISFHALAERAPQVDELGQKVDAFVELCAPIEALRNKRLAHNDLEAAIRPRDNPLPGIVRSLIEKVVSDAGGLLNYVVSKFDDAELVFEPTAVGGTEHLIFWLRLAKECDKERRDRLIGKA